MNETELITALDQWFKTPIKYKRWSRNKVGVFLRNKLIEVGHWKNKKRGNPTKAIKAMKETLAKNEFENIPFEF